MTKLEIKKILPAPQAAVFEAWTRPERLTHWFAPGALRVQKAQVDARGGGRYEITMQGPAGELHVVGGEYRVFEPNERLVFTWKWQTPDEDEMLVSIRLRPLGETTELTLVQEGFSNEASRTLHLQGWTGCFEKLDRCLADRP